MRLTKIVFASLLLASVVSCNKDDDKGTTTPTVTPTVPAAYHISYTAGGSASTYEDQKNGQYMGYTSIGNTDGTGGIYLDLGTRIAEITSGFYYGPELGIQNYFMSSSTYSADRAAALATIFAVGTKSFAPLTGGTGAYVQEVLASGVVSSVYGDNSTSTFTITESTAETDLMGNPQRKITGTFTCKLYTDAGVFVKEVTNGSFKVLIDAY